MPKMLKKEEFSIILESKLIIYPHKGWSKSTLGTFGFCQKNPSDTHPPFMMVSGPKVPPPPPPPPPCLIICIEISRSEVFSSVT